MVTFCSCLVTLVGDSCRHRVKQSVTIEAMTVHLPQSNADRPKHYEPVSKVVAELPLRRELKEPLPPTPSDLDFGRFPRTAAEIIALLPPTLTMQFRQELEQAPFQLLPDLVMDWGKRP